MVFNIGTELEYNKADKADIMQMQEICVSNGWSLEDKTDENGVYYYVIRDATAEEIAEMQAAQNDEAENLPTAEERLNDIENALLELAEIISEG